MPATETWRISIEGCTYTTKVTWPRHVARVKHREFFGNFKLIPNSTVSLFPFSPTKNEPAYFILSPYLLCIYFYIYSVLTSHATETLINFDRKLRPKFCEFFASISSRNFRYFPSEEQTCGFACLPCTRFVPSAEVVHEVVHAARYVARNTPRVSWIFRDRDRTPRYFFQRGTNLKDRDDPFSAFNSSA